MHVVSSLPTGAGGERWTPKTAAGRARGSASIRPSGGIGGLAWAAHWPQLAIMDGAGAVLAEVSGSQDAMREYAATWCEECDAAGAAGRAPVLDVLWPDGRPGEKRRRP